ncbi:MAG TPA: phosphoribosylglycinamide formyltransferase [Spirochaetia bacterium]|nr:phosphoribosylglycinamide formyltransferase [Spirochaetia bacterium]
MANLSIFASGNGSNFQAIAEGLQGTEHRVQCLVCDREGAFVIERADSLGIPWHLVSYKGRRRTEAEGEVASILDRYSIDLIALAGFMRLLSPVFVDRYHGRIINIHPSLLPKYPGTHAIVESFDSTDNELGITIHAVDYGMDTGPIIRQERFVRTGTESLDEITERIHALEHSAYPHVVRDLLNEIAARAGRST